jgi:orotidine-5'-phosphate decarboxylase
MSSYKEMLRESAKRVGNCACMGLDVQWDVLPSRTGDIYEDVRTYFETLFTTMVQHKLYPAAFKPNIGYYHALDNPRGGSFDGSLALARLLDMVNSYFPETPVILDSKRGDIARSSINYAHEAFDIWKTNAVTVSPYMGSDSVLPFLDQEHADNGIYVLNRTSNPGGKDLQQLSIVDEVDEKEIYPLYIAVAHTIAKWSKTNSNIGAVVGATHLEELKEIAAYYASKEIPLLIPGVGSQGASAKVTVAALQEVGYPIHLARINSSSGLTHPWKKSPAPTNWLEQCISHISSLLEETSC